MLQQTVNNQNYRILSKGPSAIINSNKKIIRQQKPQAETVWVAVSEKGRYLQVFIPKGVKINAEFYIKEVLEKGLLPWSEKTYGDELYCFQQDGTPAHRAKTCPNGYIDHLADFIPASEWPPSSPDDSTPLTFWSGPHLEVKVCSTHLPNLAALKKPLREEWQKPFPKKYCVPPAILLPRH
ncbi:MAG: hypothetical protein GY820_19580 [Gammaproteobacteria bacterium]|nr:hypothetical protein [Gammaproteobacteria bacterium]